MKLPAFRIISSVRTSASKLVAKGGELKDAVLPVIRGPVKPPPAFFYCADGLTVLGPISPDALYLLVCLHQTLPEDVPVALEGTEQWVPFLALDNTLFSKAVVQEVTKARAAKAAEKRKKNLRLLTIAGIWFFSGLLCLMALVGWYSAGQAPRAASSNYSAHFSPDHSLTRPFIAMPASSSSPDPYLHSLTTSAPAETPDSTRESVYVQGHWVNGYSRQLPAGEHPSQDSSTAGTKEIYVHEYTDKNGRVVHAHVSHSHHK